MIQVFEELGFVSLDQEDLIVHENPAKRSLMESKTYQHQRERERVLETLVYSSYKDLCRYLFETISFTHMGGYTDGFQRKDSSDSRLSATGVRFKDITTLLKDGKAYKEAIDQIARQLEGKEIDLIVGPEARGLSSVLLWHMPWEWDLYRCASLESCRMKRWKPHTAWNTEKMRWQCTKMPLFQGKKYWLPMICWQRAEPFPPHWN